ncbi:hypothetical protein G6F42_016498 [Rhizopus arrhizus]|nr:hypothetical protein G6F42_016498 [Rhizopus arrhizus]
MKKNIAANKKMGREALGSLPNILMLFNQNELGAAEVAKTESNTTKELNEAKTKQPKILRSMLLNLKTYFPNLSHDVAVYLWIEVRPSLVV